MSDRHLYSNEVGSRVECVECGRWFPAGKKACLHCGYPNYDALGREKQVRNYKDETEKRKGKGKAAGELRGPVA